MEWRKLDHSIVVAATNAVRGVVVSMLTSGLTVDMLCTFCSVFIVHCVKLILRTFEFVVLLFDCFVCRQNITCLRCFTKYGQKFERLVAV